MTTCHECSSAIAESDTFCPYCGIVLSVVQPPAAQEEDALESTIMITPEEAAVMAAQSKAKAEPAEDHNPLFHEIPAPAILTSTADTSGSIDIKSTSDYELRDALAAPVEPTVRASEGDQLIRETPPVAMAERIAESVQNDESLGQIISGEPRISQDHSVKEVSTEADDVELLPEVEASIFEVETEPEKLVSVEIESTQSELQADAESAMIAMPVEELPEHDPYGGPAIFDSVQIIDSRVAFSESVTKTPGADNQYIPPTEPADDIKPPSSHVVEKGETAQEIGFGDTDGKKSAKLKPLSEGTVLNGRYEIVRKIGGGGMGAVYLASDNNLGGVLRAVKEMVQAHIEEEQQDKAINDFKRESMILSTLDHPSIPTIYDYFYDDKESRFYLVMKYISGGDLSSRLRSAPEGKLDERTVTEWAIQISDVLDYLHNQPSTIVYRDLKPSNIMIDGNSGRVMLVDFGIARSISQKEEKGVTAVGTMGYAPPELFSGNVEPRSDIYSLGSTMFHLLTGADPQSNPLLIFDFQKNPRPRQINPQLTDQIEHILMRSVEYSSDARYSTAGEMRAVLKEHLQSLATGSVSYGVSEVPVSVSLANQHVFCGFCGQRIVATDLFCAFCGAKQPLAQQGVHSEIYSHSTPTARLVIEGTNELTAPAYALQKDENLVGRRDPMSNIFPEVDLSKYDPQTKISRRHARIWRDGGNFLVEDLGSSNGTILASRVQDAFRLPPHTPHMLANGDKIKVGDTTLQFVVG
ncbi:MAG: protein kinase domain-containing protein [Blastocatellia bacterium]